jgi:RpiB/LacA/LacB family sugar-phosphate isomerase
MKKIYIGSDHAGFKLKAKISKWLERKGIAFEDLGNHVLNPIDDHPDYAKKVAKRAPKEKTLGVLVCGSAQGVCIAANKIKGVRAGLPNTVKEAQLIREHNDANIICLSGWYGKDELVYRMLSRFLSTRFSKELRHRRRVAKIKKLES